MITQQHTQESLSRSFIHAVAGIAGVNLHIGLEFDYGFDGSFRPVIIRGKRRVESGFPLDFQLKCTTAWGIDEEHVAYHVETKTYNDFVTRDANGIGAVLIIACIPPIQSDWVGISEDCLILRKCCYFTFLSGTPVDNEQSKKKILVPRGNIFTSEALNKVLADERVRRMERGRDLQ